MKFAFVLVAMFVAATWSGSAWAAGASSATSATSATGASGAPSPAEVLAHKKYEKFVADLPKQLDEIQALEDKLPDQEVTINDQIHDITHKDKTGKDVPVTADAMKKELANNPNSWSTSAKKYRGLKMQIISGRMDIAKRLGTGDGLYGKWQELEKQNPKDDALKAQAAALAEKVKIHYETVLLKVATLFEAISDSSDQDGVYRMIQKVDPNNPTAAAYFKKKQGAAK